MPAWYEELFDDRYLAFYEGLLPVRPADADAEFVDRALALRPSSRILDLGCGFGRHSVPLAGRGYKVTGVDLSQVMLDHASRLARERGVEVELLRRDMRDLAGLGSFDACACLYTVIGYFDDDENERVIRGVRDVLVPGGRFLLDLTNPIPMMRQWPGTTWREMPSGVTRESSTYDPMTGRLSARKTIFRTDGRQEEIPGSVVRMYAPHETARMLRASGFEIEQVYGGLRDKPFRWKRSMQQVWVARRT